jgi:hypothetical protein
MRRSFFRPSGRLQQDGQVVVGFRILGPKANRISVVLFGGYLVTGSFEYDTTIAVRFRVVSSKF